MPLLLAACAVALLALSATAWRSRWWSSGQRVHFVVVMVAAVALVLVLNGWGLVGLGV